VDHIGQINAGVYSASIASIHKLRHMHGPFHRSLFYVCNVQTEKAACGLAV